MRLCLNFFRDAGTAMPYFFFMLGGMSFMDFMVRGGALMWVLLAFSFVAFAVTIERTLTYIYYGFSPDRWLQSLLQTIRTSGSAAALSLAVTCRHPVARVVQTYLEELN
ncbi:MAG: hypothetical protein EBX90_13395, partial [Betaproteobacteria bacterium]|nr:hypothetical protein [Betaproteobacteria bacterium]